MQTLKVVFVSIVTLLFCQPLLAEKAVVLKPHSNFHVKPETIELIQGLIAEWIEQRGIDIVPWETAVARVPESVRKCSDPTCALSYLHHLSEVELILVSRLSNSTSDSNPPEITISVVTREGDRYERSWPLSEAFELAVDAALTYVYMDLLRGRPKETGTGGVWEDVALSNETDIERRSLPSTPDETEPSASNKKQVVQESVADSAPIPKSIKSDVPTDMDREKPLKYPSAWNYIIGSGLFLGAVSMLVAPMYTAINQNKLSHIDGDDRYVYYFGSKSIALSGGSALLLATSIYFFWAAPITVESTISGKNGQAVLRLSGKF